MDIKMDDVKITMQLKNIIKHEQTQAMLKKIMDDGRVVVEVVDVVAGEWWQLKNMNNYITSQHMWHAAVASLAITFKCS